MFKNTDIMKNVSREYFYKKIGVLDACVSVENVDEYPYTCLFKMRYGTLIGKTVDEYTDNIKKRYPIITKYYTNL